MAKTDLELIREFQAGSEAAFAELVERYKAKLINYFYRLLWDRQKSEDLCQEVFCRVFLHRKRYVPTASFGTYLYRIGRNLWIDLYRSSRNDPPVMSLDADVSGEGHSLGSRVEKGGPDPSYATEVTDEMRRVQLALDALAPDLKETLILVKYQGLKYQEAADVLDVPVGTVRSRIHAALEQVRVLLGIEAAGKDE